MKTRPVVRAWPFRIIDRNRKDKKNMWKNLIMLSVFTVLIMAIGFQANAAPANDNFADAQPLSLSQPSVTGTNIDATREIDEPFQQADRLIGKSVWWSFLAETSGSLTVSTLGSATAEGLAMDTTLWVYTGTSVGNLNPGG